MKKNRFRRQLITMIAISCMISGCGFIKTVFNGNGTNTDVNAASVTSENTVDSVAAKNITESLIEKKEVEINKENGKSSIARIGTPSGNDYDKIHVFVSPTPLSTSCNNVNVRYDIYFPKDYITPNTRVEITPILIIDSTNYNAQNMTVQGAEFGGKADKIMNNEGGLFSGTGTFAYNYDGKIPNRAEFLLIMKTIKHIKDSLNVIKSNTKIDTLYTSNGLSYADRFVNTENCFLVAYKNSLLNDLPIDTLKKMIATRSDNLKSILDNMSTSAMAANNEGVLEVHTGNYKKAKAKFLLSLLIDSTLCEPCHNLGVIAIIENDYTTARRYFESIKDINKQPEACRAMLGYCIGDYNMMANNSNGVNKALAEILSDNLRGAWLTVKDEKGQSAELIKMIILAREGRFTELDSLISNSNTSKISSNDINIVKNERAIYNK